MDVVVIGGGASGMIAALNASKTSNVILLEKKSKLGSKLRITGKGRCNITFDGDREYMMQNITTNSKFIYSAYNSFSNYDALNFFKEMGIKIKLERGNRYFLESEDANEVADKLTKKLIQSNVKIKYNETVNNIQKIDDKFSITTNTKTYIADKCIIATGGMSYPNTGSTGDGYKLLEKLGHTIIPPKPALVGIKSNDEICRELSGLSLKNVNVKLVNNNKTVYEKQGEMLFSHFGLTGPVILSASSKINRLDNYDNLFTIIDLKPALSYEKLENRILRDFEKFINKEFKNSLNDLLPKNMIKYIILESKINENKKVNQITSEERKRLVEVIKNVKIKIDGLMDIKSGIVTAGGINVKEVNPKSMESKICSNLYISGELLDIDAYTGGFNLQIAFSTGFLSGLLLK